VLGDSAAERAAHLEIYDPEVRDGVEPSGFGSIPKGIETGAVQPRAPPPVIAVFSVAP
jgi:hypothetical protein